MLSGSEVTPGYTGKRRVNNPFVHYSAEKALPRAVPELPCPQCGGRAAVEPALTVTSKGVTTTSWPVTCKAGCVETYTKRGRDYTRKLRTYIPSDCAEPLIRPLPEMKKEETEVKEITDEDREMLRAVRQIRQDRGLTWDDIAAPIGFASTTVGSAVRDPERCLRPAVKAALYQWVANQSKPLDEAVPEESIKLSVSSLDLASVVAERDTYKATLEKLLAAEFAAIVQDRVDRLVAGIEVKTSVTILMREDVHSEV